MTQQTKIILAQELWAESLPKTHIAQRLQVHRDTIHEWLKGIAAHPDGLSGYLKDYEQAKKGPRPKRKTDGLLKARIYRIREDNHDCCAQKIQEYLFAETGQYVSVPTIYKILAQKYTLRSKWKKHCSRGDVPKALAPRQVIQMDSVQFGMVFAFTAVDTYSRDVCVKLYPSLNSRDGEHFLHYAFATRFGHTAMLQTDGGSEFKGEFRSQVFHFTDRFRVARSYKKNEQAFIESFNRTLRKECLGWRTFSPSAIPALEKELTAYLNYYHAQRIHMGLHMKTPNQVLREWGVSDI